MFGALTAAQIAAASLRIGFGDSGEAIIQILDDPKSGYRLTIDCVGRCFRPLHYAEPISDTPLGLMDLGREGLVYSVGGTGCCYIVRVWKVSSGRVERLLETGSRGLPSLETTPGLSIVTFMRPIDAAGHETGMVPQPVRWIYSKGQFRAPELKVH